MRKPTSATILLAIVAIVALSVIGGLIGTAFAVVQSFDEIALKGDATPARVVAIPWIWVVAAATAIVFPIFSLIGYAKSRHRQRR